VPLAFDILSKDSKQWDVHFHFEDGICEGKALPLLWDAGAYFDSECLESGKLHLFAHFEPKDGRNPALGTPATSTAPSFNRPPTEAPSLAIPSSSTGNLCEEARNSSATRNRSPTQPQLVVSIPRSGKRANDRDLFDSESDTSDEENFLLSPSDSGRLSNGEGVIDGLVQSSQSSLPAGATAAQHAIDFDAACSSNAPQGKYGHKHNWDEIQKEYKIKVGHAKLIKGIYGQSVAQPCERCIEKGIACRKYHPDLHAVRATPGPCGECRLWSITCGTKGYRKLKERGCPKLFPRCRNLGYSVAGLVESLARLVQLLHARAGKDRCVTSASSCTMFAQLIRNTT
jgi:hypothetical protein